MEQTVKLKVNVPFTAEELSALSEQLEVARGMNLPVI
jgi:predicted metal-dependent TIM-barrel fold hydrolase